MEINSKSPSFLFLFLFFVIFSVCHATGFLHKGKDQLGGTEDIVLKGHSFTEEEAPLDVDDNVDAIANTIRQVDFYVHLERSVIVWDEVSQSGASLTCSKSLSEATSALPSGEYVFKISGGGVEAADLPTKANLVFSSEEWENVCGEYLDELDAFDEEDDTLFMEIIATTEDSAGTFIVHARQVVGKDVAPIVDVDIHHEKLQSGATSTGTFYEEGSTPVSSRIIHSSQHFTASDSLRDSNVTLENTSERASGRFRKTIALPSGIGSLYLYASVSAGVTRFRFTRWYRLQFQWEQYLYAYLSGYLTIAKASKGTKGGSLARYWIPGLTFSARIPFIARLRAGAILGTNWVLEMDVNVKANLRFVARYQRREQVTAQLLPPQYSARDILTRSSNYGYTSVSVAGSHVNARFNGFGGVRPYVGVGVELKRRSWFRWKTYRVDGNVGATVGVDVQTGVKYNPAYPIFSGPGRKIGVCNKCHAIRGSAKIIGKKLSAQLVRGSTVVKEHIFKQSLFQIPLGTVCGLPVAC